MRNVSTIHLPPASPEEQVEIAGAIRDLEETAGWQALTDAIEAVIVGKTGELCSRSPREGVGEYERLIGEIGGLNEVEAIVNGLKERAERLEGVPA